MFPFVLGALWLLSIVAGCVWATRVPPFEEPDESAHADYAFALYDVGHPLRFTRPHIGLEVTPQVRYLERISDYRRMRYNPVAVVRPEYGSAAYLRETDARAPIPSHAVPPPGSAVPYLMTYYPIGFYALASIVMTVAGGVTHGSLWAAFLSARFFGVFLTATAGLVTYFTLRTLRVRRGTALLGYVAAAFFPLAASIGGSVQPDTLSYALFSLTLLLAVRFETDVRQRSSYAFALACVLALLFLTKPQYAAGAWIAALALVVTARGAYDLRRVAIVVAIVASAPLGWLAANVFSPVGALDGAKTLVVHGLSGAGPSLLARSGHTASLLGDAFATAFLGGAVFRSYWFSYGIRAGTVFPHTVIDVLSGVLAASTVAAFVTIAFVQFGALRRLAVVARRRGFARALRGLGSAVAINAYLVVSAAIFAAFVWTDGALVLQGRYWLPVLPATLVILLTTVPKIARDRATRDRIAAGIAVVLASYSLCAAPSALARMNADFYGPSRPLQRDSLAAVDSLSRGPVLPAGTRETALHVRFGTREIVVGGYAIDQRTGLPAAALAITVDGAPRVRLGTGVSRMDVRDVFHDDALIASGYEGRLAIGDLSPGRHEVGCRLAPLPGDAGVPCSGGTAVLTIEPRRS